jgi:hypothetical protein
MLGKDYKIEGCRCLSCKQLVDGATCVEGDRRPTPGDITVCIFCGHIMAYDAGDKLRELTREEQISIAGDKRILRIQEARAFSLLLDKLMSPKGSIH